MRSLSTIRLATPLLLAALGGLFSERSGVINIALEGLMLAGAFTAAAVTYAVRAVPGSGLLAGIAAGLLVAAIHAVACIKFKADQVVSGTAINILFLGVPALLSGAFFLVHRSDAADSRRTSSSRMRPSCIAFAAGAGDLVRAVPHAVRFAPAGGGREPGGRGCGGGQRGAHALPGVMLVRRAGGDRRRVSLDRPVVAVHAQHDGRAAASSRWRR